MTVEPSEIDIARRFIARAREDLLQVDESLTRFDGSAAQLEQAMCLAAAVEALRAASRNADAACVRLADAAMVRGVSPRVLDWTDGTPG